MECNNKVVDYLNIIFNLNDGNYKSYHKQENKITYSNVQLNHPPNINKQLSKTTTNNGKRTTTAQKLL